MSNDYRQRAVQIVLAERHRQVTKENWTEQHDDTHTNGCLAVAAASYALSAASTTQVSESTKLSYVEQARRMFPFDIEDWWKPTPDSPIRDLVKAGALILSEIERMLRAEDLPPPPGKFRCSSCRSVSLLSARRMSFNFGSGIVDICFHCASEEEAAEATKAVNTILHK